MWKTNSSSARQRWVAVCFALVLPGLLGVACTRESDQETAEAPGQPTMSAELELKVQDLQQELDKREDTVTELREQIDALRKQVPEPSLVHTGDSHWGIAYDFLTDKRGLAPESAKRELASFALFEPVLAGNQIWNFYDGDTFGSFVTQADAHVSPGALARAQTRDAEEVKEERNRLQTRVATLEDNLSEQRARLDRELAGLEGRLETKQDEVESLRSYIDATLQQEQMLRNEVAQLTERLSSVYYVAGTSASLEAQGKVRSSWIGGNRLGATLESADFERRVDLRETDAVELTASELGVPRIDDVDVLPSYWERGEDYRINVASDGKSATVELLNKEQFRLRTLLLLVNS